MIQLRLSPVGLAVVAISLNLGGIVADLVIVLAYFSRRKAFPSSVIFHHFVALWLAGVSLSLNVLNGFESDKSELPPGFCMAQVTCNV